MPCTTVLVGKKASHDGSTMIARNDDGRFDTKKLVVVTPDKQPKTYKSVIGHLTVELPDNPMAYTACPNVDRSEGIWAACGINEAHVGMTATETITSNPRVLGADPLVEYKKAEKRGEKDVPGGIGEEDLVVLVLPYIRTAREGVERVGALLEQYGTYEMNGIGFNDENEVWWLETIGGHHWIAKRVKDEEVVIMPNQFGMDAFDFEDAFGKKEAHLCSADLKEFMAAYHLDLNQDGVFNPRYAFGSHTDADHVYNTPRAWYMGRYFLPTTYRWEGEDADFTPESDDIPWSFVPEKKVTPEDVKYVLSTHFQGTPYDPYRYADNPKKGMYRSIGVTRTDVMAILQIRGYMPGDLKSVEWISFGSNVFNTSLPVYTAVREMPKYLSDVSTDISTDTFFWGSRLIGALADPHFAESAQQIERYQDAVASKARAIIHEYDAKYLKENDPKLLSEANRKLCDLAKKETVSALNKVLITACENMKNNYKRSDN